MAKIVISEEVSLDGVVQDPTGEEGFRHGGWFNQIGDETRQAWAEVKTKPSEVITTPLPAPSSIRPPRTRRETRKLATDGVS